MIQYDHSYELRVWHGHAFYYVHGGIHLELNFMFFFNSLLCKIRVSYKIKENIQISHIPVILLTAKTTVGDQVQGLDSGADAYVTKPFEPQYLKALIASQLRNRAKVRAMLSESTDVEELEEDVLSPQDNAFMTELYQLMEKEL